MREISSLESEFQRLRGSGSEDLYHVPDDVLDRMSVFGCDGEWGIVLVMLLVDLLVEQGVFVEESVGPVEEGVLHHQAEQEVPDMLPATSAHTYKGGKEKSRFILTNPTSTPKGKYTKCTFKRVPKVLFIILRQFSLSQCQGFICFNKILQALFCTSLSKGACKGSSADRPEGIGEQWRCAPRSPKQR